MIINKPHLMLMKLEINNNNNKFNKVLKISLNKNLIQDNMQKNVLGYFFFIIQLELDL